MIQSIQEGKPVNHPTFQFSSKPVLPGNTHSKTNTPSKSPVLANKFLDSNADDSKNQTSIPISPRVLNLDKVRVDETLQRSQDNKENVYSNKLEPKKPEQPLKSTQIKLKKDIPVFQRGKKVPKESDSEIQSILNVFKLSGNKVSKAVFTDQIVKQHLKLPKFMGGVLFDKISGGKPEVDSKTFTLHQEKNLSQHCPKSNFFQAVSGDGLAIRTTDLKPILQNLLSVHPGLLFLESTPEFQERQADTVIIRIFWTQDLDDSGSLTLQDVKKGNLQDVFMKVDQEDDINNVRELFSQEHFYVLQCRFWELDQDHDFLITKDEFAKQEGHALSRKAVDRIFAEVPKKLKGTNGLMCQEDFVCFMLAEEDKTSERSLHQWFQVVDLDDNGIICPKEMEFFYSEQQRRMEQLNNESVIFEDILCQMSDMVKPAKSMHFTLKDFKRNRDLASAFFNSLVNLNKFIAFEQRDPFQQRNELNDTPGQSEWDRFARQEQNRLSDDQDMDNDYQDGGADYDSDFDEKDI